jgi:hypothetical protein
LTFAARPGRGAGSFVDDWRDKYGAGQRIRRDLASSGAKAGASTSPCDDREDTRTIR